MNVGVLLAAGNGRRFNGQKQLYQIGNKSLTSISFDAMQLLDEVIVVTNTLCHHQMAAALPTATIVINDVDSRLQSINVALDYLGDRQITNILIHDAARPFITTHVKDLLGISEDYQYAQFFLKLVNGLVKKNGMVHEVVNRDDYIELCTPQIMRYQLFRFLFKTFIHQGPACEILPLADLFKIKYKLLEGRHKHLRKVTTLDDVE